MNYEHIKPPKKLKLAPVHEHMDLTKYLAPDPTPTPTPATKINIKKFMSLPEKKRKMIYDKMEPKQRRKQEMLEQIYMLRESYKNAPDGAKPAMRENLRKSLEKYKEQK